MSFYYSIHYHKLIIQQKNFCLYILRLLAGKFRWICTAFPLATFFRKFKKPSRIFPAKDSINNISENKHNKLYDEI